MSIYVSWWLSVVCVVVVGLCQMKYSLYVYNMQINGIYIDWKCEGFSLK